MRTSQLLAMNLESEWRPRPRFRTVEISQAPYLSEVRPINQEPVRVALDEEPPRLTPEAPAMRAIEKAALVLTFAIAAGFGVVLCRGRGTHAEGAEGRDVGGRAVPSGARVAPDQAGPPGLRGRPRGLVSARHRAGSGAARRWAPAISSGQFSSVNDGPGRSKPEELSC